MSGGEIQGYWGSCGYHQLNGGAAFASLQLSRTDGTWSSRRVFSLSSAGGATWLLVIHVIPEGVGAAA